jgi:hypothetical protein
MYACFAATLSVSASLTSGVGVKLPLLWPSVFAVVIVTVTASAAFDLHAM